MKLPIILITLISMGCQEGFEASNLAHTFGSTTRSHDRNYDCQGSDSPADLKNFDLYLRDLAELIATANPEAFKGQYAIDKFCFSTIRSMELNAYAWSLRRHIYFNLNTILTAGSDAEVAAVLAHELAHVTMAHGIVEPNNFGESKEWQDAEKTYNNSLAVTNSKIESIKSNHKRHYETRDGLIASVNSLINSRNEFVYYQGYYAFLGEKGILEKLYQERGRALSQIEAWTDSHPGSLQAIDELNVLEKIRLKSLEAIMKLEANVRDLHVNLSYNAKDHEKLAIDKVFSEAPYLLKKAWQLNEKILQDPDRQVADLLGEQEIAYQKWMAVGSRLTGIARFDKFNWEEAEADEVGFEFYLKAGFRAEEFFNFEKKVVSDSYYKDCMAQVSNALAGADQSIPERGRVSHPYPCYRIYDNMVLAPQAHTEIEVLIKRNQITEVFPGRLAKIR